MQIRSKLTLQFLLIVALIIAFCFSIIYASSSRYRENEFYERLKKKAITTADFFIKVDQVDSSFLRLIDRTQKDHLFNENISIFDYKNKEVFTNNDTLMFHFDKTILNNIRLDGEYKFTDSDFEVIGLNYRSKYEHFIILAGARDIYGLSKLRNLRNTLFLLFFIIMGVVSLAGWIFAGRALKPILTVIKAVTRISADTLNARIDETKNKDEINELIRTFNNLLGRLEEAFKLQKIFIASASHELLNPLTVITSQLEVALLNERSVQEYKKIINSVLDDMNGLNEVTSKLLELARLETFGKEIISGKVRLDEVLWQCRNDLSQKHPGFTIGYEIKNLPEDEQYLWINGNEALLRLAFINVIENACKFSDNKKVNIVFTYDSNKNQIGIHFIDEGPGVDEKELPLIFEPFYRTTNASGTKGHGVGLPLVQRILKLHGADISIHSQRGKGTKVSMYFHF